MNLQGINNTDKGESYFWKVCGTASVLIIFTVSLCAFWYRLSARNVARDNTKSMRGAV